MKNTQEMLATRPVHGFLDFAEVEGGGEVMLGLNARAGRMPVSDLRIEQVLGHGSTLVWNASDGLTEMVELQHARAIEQAALSSHGLLLAEITPDGFDESTVQIVRVERDQAEVCRG